MMSYRLVLAGAAVGIWATPALAQTVGTVFGPEVDPDETGIELRVAVVPEEGDNDTRTTTRLHYQAPLSDTLRWRAIVQGSDRETGDWEFNYLQGELLWQTVARTPSGYSSGFRFDFRLNEGDDGAHQVGANWTNQWMFSDGWRARALLLLDADVGDRRRDGLFVETRMNLSRRLENGVRIGIESFNGWGNTDAGFGSWHEQDHAGGPYLSVPLENGWSLGATALLGLSDDASDTDIQLRLNRDF